MDSDDVISPVNDITEEEVCQKIEDTYGFYPVTFGYLPSNMEFQDAIFSDAIHQIALVYQGEDGRQMLCRIYLSHNEHSREMDIEDNTIGTSSVQLPATTVMLKEQEVTGDRSPRWTAEFTYQNVYYIYTISGIEKEEVRKVVENLNFYE